MCGDHLPAGDSAFAKDERASDPKGVEFLRGDSCVRTREKFSGPDQGSAAY